MINFKIFNAIQLNVILFSNKHAILYLYKTQELQLKTL